MFKKINSYLNLAKKRGYLASLLHHSVQFLLPLLKKASVFKPKKFYYNGRAYSYCLEKYGATWANERSVEIPVFIELLKAALNKNKKVLEIGNVLSHYVENSGRWTVVDKYESAEGVINADILTFSSKKKFDLILSISTMEHVGYDENPRDPKKIENSIENIKSNLLAKNGSFVFSIPIGYNSLADKLLFKKLIAAKSIQYMKRFGMQNWKLASLNEVKTAKYGDMYYGSASAIAIAIIE